MKVLGWLVVSCVLCGVYASQCIYDTMKCSRFWQPLNTPFWMFSPRMFWVGPEDLRIVCRLQKRFFTCIDQIAYRNREEIHPIFLEPMTMMESLCDEKSGLYNSILGTVYAPPGSSALCSYETMKCNPLWPRIRPESILPYQKSNIDTMCKYQQDFFNCIRNVSSKVCNGEFHPILQRSEALHSELCDRNSAFFKAYNKSIGCINSYGYYQCYKSAKDPNDMTFEEYCRYKNQGFDCVSSMIKIFCKKILPEGLDIWKIVETMQIDEPYYCYTPAETALINQFVHRTGDIFPTGDTESKPLRIQQTGGVPFQRFPLSYKPELVYAFEDGRPDSNVKPELNTFQYENGNIYQGGAYLYSEPSITWPNKNEMSADLVDDSTDSFLDHLEKATETADPLHELENIIGDYVEKISKQMD